MNFMHFAVITALFVSPPIVACDGGTNPTDTTTDTVATPDSTPTDSTEPEPDTVVQPDDIVDTTSPDTLPELCESVMDYNGEWRVVNMPASNGQIMDITSETAYWDGAPNCVTTLEGEGSPFNDPFIFVGEDLPLSAPTGVSDTKVFTDGDHLCIQAVNRDTAEVYLDIRYVRN